MNTLMRTNDHFPSLIENSASAVRFGRDINDFFNASSSGVTNIPAVNVVEHQDGFRIEVAAPGLKKEDFKLNLNCNNLTISASQETQKGSEKYTRREFSYSSFQRTFTLPTSIDAERIQATYTDGLLKIDVPKREEAKVKPPRQIEIGG